MIYLQQIYTKEINYAVISLLYVPENAIIEMRIGPRQPNDIFIL